LKAELEQGEVEHKKSKSRYSRTSRKPGFEGQIAKIERRQYRISRLMETRMKRRGTLTAQLGLISDPLSKNLDSEYSVGKSQNLPLNVYDFLQKHEGDPAVAVSWLQLFPCQ
jgi:hypothetical protein